LNGSRDTDGNLIYETRCDLAFPKICGCSVMNDSAILFIKCEKPTENSNGKYLPFWYIFYFKYYLYDFFKNGIIDIHCFTLNANFAVTPFRMKIKLEQTYEF